MHRNNIFLFYPRSIKNCLVVLMLSVAYIYSGVVFYLLPKSVTLSNRVCGYSFLSPEKKYIAEIRLNRSFHHIIIRVAFLNWIKHFQSQFLSENLVKDRTIFNVWNIKCDTQICRFCDIKKLRYILRDLFLDAHKIRIKMCFGIWNI